MRAAAVMRRAAAYIALLSLSALACSGDTAGAILGWSSQTTRVNSAPHIGEQKCSVIECRCCTSDFSSCSCKCAPDESTSSGAVVR